MEVNTPVENKYSPEKLKRTQEFLTFCQSSLLKTDYTSNSEIRNYCKENRISSAYFPCLISMGYIDKKGMGKATVYKWKIAKKVFEPIDARRFLECVSQRAKENNDTTRIKKENTLGVITHQKVQKKQNKPSKPKKIEVVQAVKETSKTTVITEVSYLWGLFKRSTKKEI